MINPLFSAGIVAVALLGAAPAAATTLADVRRAFDSTASMQADFRQVAADGREARGVMLLKRPGRIRFDYGPKANFLVVANGQRLSFIDYKVGQVSEWPLKATPLGVLLDRDADLSRLARVLPESESPMPGQVAVLARDPRRADIGSILFFLQPDPRAPGGLRLTGWRVTDAQGNLTVVELSNIRFNLPIAESSFRFRDPRPAQVPGRTG